MTPHADPEERRAYQREYQRRWARENRDKRVLYERSHRERNREAYAAKTKRSVERNRVKVNAANTLRRAIARGEIQRMPCERCGAPNSHGHHDDYSQPLVVRWLCPLHHAEAHRSDS
jgi:hypothetical protein